MMAQFFAISFSSSRTMPVRDASRAAGVKISSINLGQKWDIADAFSKPRGRYIKQKSQKKFEDAFDHSYSQCFLGMFLIKHVPVNNKLEYNKISRQNVYEVKKPNAIS